MVHRVCQIFMEWITIPAVTIVGRAPTLGLATLPGTENDDFPFFEVWKPSNVWFLASKIVILPTMGMKLIQNTSKRPTHGILTIRKSRGAPDDGDHGNCDPLPLAPGFRPPRPSKEWWRVRRRYHGSPLTWSREPQDPRTWQKHQLRAFSVVFWKILRSESVNVACLVLKLFRNCAILKLQPAPQIVQPKGRICLHVLHALHHLLMPKTCLQVQVMYCMISFWIQKLIMHCMTWRFQASWLSRLAGQERKVESKRWSMPSRCCCIYMAYKKMPVERPKQKDTKRSKDLLPEYSAVLGSHVSHARSSVWALLSQQSNRPVPFWTSRKAAPAGNWNQWLTRTSGSSRDARLQSRAALNSLRKRPRWHTQVPPVMVIHKKLQALWYALILKGAVLCSRRGVS